MLCYSEKCKLPGIVGFLSLLHSGHIGPKRSQSPREELIILLFKVHPTLYFCLSTFPASDQPVPIVGGNSEGKANNTSEGEIRMLSILEYIRKILQN